MGAKGWRSKCGFSVYFSGIMEHLVSTSRKARGHILGLLCNAEKTKSVLALERVLQIC